MATSTALKRDATGVLREGREAMRAGKGRSSNPYPGWATNERHDWFEGYDRELERLSVEENKTASRVRSW